MMGFVTGCASCSILLLALASGRTNLPAALQLEVRVAAGRTSDPLIVERAAATLGSEVADGGEVVARWVPIADGVRALEDPLALPLVTREGTALVLIGPEDVTAEPQSWSPTTGFSGRAALHIRLSPDAGERMYEFCKANIGRTAAVIIGGKVREFSVIRGVASQDLVVTVAGQQDLAALLEAEPHGQIPMAPIAHQVAAIALGLSLLLGVVLALIPVGEWHPPTCPKPVLVGLAAVWGLLGAARLGVAKSYGSGPNGFQINIGIGIFGLILGGALGSTAGWFGGRIAWGAAWRAGHNVGRLVRTVLGPRSAS